MNLPKTNKRAASLIILAILMLILAYYSVELVFFLLLPIIAFIANKKFGHNEQNWCLSENGLEIEDDQFKWTEIKTFSASPKTINSRARLPILMAEIRVQTIDGRESRFLLYVNKARQFEKELSQYGRSVSGLQETEKKYHEVEERNKKYGRAIYISVAIFIIMYLAAAYFAKYPEFRNAIKKISDSIPYFF